MSTEQFITPLSISSSAVTLMVCSICISAKHPVEQLQLNSLSDGGEGKTEQFRVRAVPTKYSKALVDPGTGLPSGSGTTLTV